MCQAMFVPSRCKIIYVIVEIIEGFNGMHPYGKMDSNSAKMKVISIG